MNDYQMTILAADRRRQLMAEADGHRLARGGRRRASMQVASPLRRSLETASGFLQRRTPASRPR